MARYKKNDYKETNELGAKYASNPLPETAAQLLEAFGPLIEMYITLLSPGRRIEVKGGLSTQTKEFLWLFKQPGELTTGNYQDYYAIIKRLPNMAKQALLTDEDLRQSLVLIFLTVAQKFDGRGGFTGYINRFFKWEVRELIFKSKEDASKYQPLYEEIIEDQPFFGYDVDFEEACTRIHHGHEIIDGTLVDTYIDLPKLSLTFISLPDPPYDTLLTQQERRVMVHILVNRKSPSAIAEDLEYSNATIVRRIWVDAIQKIRDYWHIQTDVEPPCKDSDLQERWAERTNPKETF